MPADLTAGPPVPPLVEVAAVDANPCPGCFGSPLDSEEADDGR